MKHINRKTLYTAAGVIALILLAAVCKGSYDLYRFHRMEPVKFAIYFYNNDETVIYEYHPKDKRTETIGRLPGRFFNGRMSVDGTYIMGLLTHYDNSKTQAEYGLEIVRYYFDSGDVEVCLGKEEGMEILKDWENIYQHDLFYSHGEIYDSYVYTDMDRILLGEEILYDLETGELSYVRQMLDDDTRDLYIRAVGEDAIFYEDKEDRLYRFDMKSRDKKFLNRNPYGKCHVYNDGDKIACTEKKNKALILYNAKNKTWWRTVNAGWNSIIGSYPKKEEEMYWTENGQYLFYEKRCWGSLGGWSSTVKVYDLNSGISRIVYRDTNNSSNKVSFILPAERKR